MVDPANPTTRDHVRFAIDDVTPNDGPRPGGANFTDAEIDMVIAAEGNWQRAVAGLLEVLHSHWVDHVSWQADGTSVSMSHVPKGYMDRAKEMRRKYGGTPGTQGYARSIIRIDGYSQDKPSDMVDDVSYSK